MPGPLPCSDGRKMTPAFSRASRTATMIPTGTFPLPFSIRTIFCLLTPTATARSVCDMFTRTRAALISSICSCSLSMVETDINGEKQSMFSVGCSKMTTRWPQCPWGGHSVRAAERRAQSAGCHPCEGDLAAGEGAISRAAITAQPEKQTYQAMKSAITSSMGDLLA